MEETQAFENRVLERLNAGKTVRSFLIATVELLTEAVNILVLQVFRKDDYAVKYAVEPLLEGSGPLGDLSVRLKLIYGLGVISRAEYEDAELLMALREELNHDGNEYSFTDDEIIGPFGELHCVAALPPTPQFDDSDAELLAMQKLRYQQMVRSTMVLSLTELISRISLKKPSRNQRSDSGSVWSQVSTVKLTIIFQTLQKQRFLILRDISRYMLQPRRLFQILHKCLTGSHKINRFVD